MWGVLRRVGLRFQRVVRVVPVAVEVVAGDRERVDVLLGVSEADGYWSVSRTQSTRRPVAVVVLLIRSTMTWWVRSGLPRQFKVIWEKSRCSILFQIPPRPSSAASTPSSMDLQQGLKVKRKAGEGGLNHGGAG